MNEIKKERNSTEPRQDGRQSGADGKRSGRGEHAPRSARPGAGARRNSQGGSAPRSAKPAAGEKRRSFGDSAPRSARPAAGEKRDSRGNSAPRSARPAPGRKPERFRRESGENRNGTRGFRRPEPERSGVEGMAPRRTALKVLREVTEEGAYASLSLDRALTGSGLSAADRRLASRLVYDTLDNLGYLDHLLGQVMAREDTDLRLRNILRLGACQMLVEDRIPESAATNTSVQLCTEIGLESLKGVCNGILRNLIRKKEELTLPDPEKEPEKYFSVRYSVPEWLGTRLRQDWGAEEAAALVSWRNQDAPITIRRNLLKTGEESFEALLARKIWGREKAELPGAWRITGAMDISRDADFLAGNYSIQSESSMMVCLALGVRRGMQVLDCCAAPGGKTCYLAELMGDTGRVQAWDVHEHRVGLIAAQQRRLGLENIRPILRDATRPREDLETRMDAVLLDAPCSGLGVMAEKPDIRLRVTEAGVAELTGLQARLLDTVCHYVKPGGVLVYSTCSVLKAENEDQVRAFLEKHPEFEAERLPESIPEKFRRHEGLGLQLLPHRDGVEGFYFCRMRRRADSWK